MIELKVESQIMELVNNAESKPVLIFKYSPICHVSFYVQAEFEKFVSENTQALENLILCQVDVVGARPISRKIESIFSIRHESPQALLVHNGEVIWHDSHNQINKATLKSAIHLLI